MPKEELYADIILLVMCTVFVVSLFMFNPTFAMFWSLGSGLISLVSWLR